MRALPALVMLVAACDYPALSHSVGGDAQEGGDAHGADAQGGDDAHGGDGGTDVPAADASLSCSGVDEQTDPNNCGACGHSCLGGTCSGGLCQAVTLAISDAPQGLTVDSTNVYWANSGAATIGYAAIDAIPNGAPPGPSQTELVPSYESFPQGLGVIPKGTSEVLVWGVYSFDNAGAIESCDPASCSNTLNTTWVPNANLTNYINVDTLGAYWNTLNGAIEACTDVAGCNTPTVVAPAVSGATTSNPVGDGQGRIYWMTSSGGNSLLSAPVVAAANVTTLASGLSGVPGILVSQGNVIWCLDGEIYSCPTNGCGLPTFVADAPNCQSLSADSASLYVIEYDRSSSANVSTLLGCERANCAATMKTLLTLTGSTTPATSAAPYGTMMWGIDAKRIYLVDYGNGQIGWVAR